MESTQATITLTKEAADRGADAVLVKNPFYFKSQMTFDVYMAHYTAVADASAIPVIIYNVPVFTGVPLQSRLVIELAKHPNILGMKDSSGDVKLISELIWNTDPAKFPVLAGPRQRFRRWPQARVEGSSPLLAQRRNNACAVSRIRRGRLQEAGAIQRIIAPAAGAVTENGITGLKAAMELEGISTRFASAAAASSETCAA